MKIPGIGVVSIAALCGTLLAAQTPVQPGAAHTSADLSSTLRTPSAVSSSAVPSVTTVEIETEHERTVRHLWIASILSAAAASGSDAATSWGKREGNGLLASSDGTFGLRGLGIKGGMMAAVIVPQILLRKHKDLRTRFIIGNFAETGIFAGVSVHNLGVTSSR